MQILKKVNVRIIQFLSNTPFEGARHLIHSEA